MSEGVPEVTIRRILIAIDASPHSMAALHAAAELASHLGAELVGLYVEDINLLRMAELPFSREVSYYSATLRLVNRDEIEKEIRGQARRARLAFSTIAERKHVRSSFRVTRGVITTELLQAAAEVDLVTMGKAGWSRQKQMGSTARLVVAQAPQQTLVLQYGARLRMPLGVVYDGSHMSRKALASSASIIHRGDDYLIVFILANEFEQARSLQSELRNWQNQSNVEARFRWLIGKDGHKLMELIRSEDLGTLVLPGESEVLSLEALSAIVNNSDIPVLVVR